MNEEFNLEPSAQRTNGRDHEVVHVQMPKKAEKPTVDYSHMITVIKAWQDILNARLLALLSMIGTLIGFFFVMWEPEPLRLWGLGIYAVLCQFPILALYFRKG